MALAMTLLGVVTSSWAGNFNLPEVADVNDVFAAPAVFKAGAQAPQFTLSPVIVGDVNRDGTMNITDVTELIDALLSNNDYGLNPRCLWTGCCPALSKPVWELENWLVR